MKVLLVLIGIVVSFLLGTNFRATVSVADDTPLAGLMNTWEAFQRNRAAKRNAKRKAQPTKPPVPTPPPAAASPFGSSRLSTRPPFGGYKLG